MFYLGDADPFGAEIFLTYLFGSLKNQNHNLMVCLVLLFATALKTLHFEGPEIG